MSQRPERSEYGDFYAQYISLVPAEGELYDIFRKQSDDMFVFLGGLSEVEGNYRYAPEKWSIKQIVGHLIDSDRIMSYRLLRISRGDTTPLAGYEENDYVKAGQFERFSLNELLYQYKVVRESTLVLLATLPEDVWEKVGIANNASISARAQVCILIGHELHHWEVIKERYLK
ncbi:DinB family protein [Paenibacillus sp. 19GGS1-52]|uniref:DinB family protein n=1 Tax=Paenibacillus sp. 19GGS1-52 TaxID=2758563 RepID=UPI001EFBFB8A|nr:DinB family protein [Paenibacillus sp. 19GGS1-52]ULO09167.1 DinB family protein [Paenibacillus sp. 19GGS1-52]